MLPFIGKEDKLFDGDAIHMDSLRYLTFATSGIECVECGIKGLYFAKETDDCYSENPRYHLNLYAKNNKGKEVLMTKDHIIPKSLGGRNNIQNLQTMCCNCNYKKGSNLK